jgi:hypothetical protein
MSRRRSRRTPPRRDGTRRLSPKRARERPRRRGAEKALRKKKKFSGGRVQSFSSPGSTSATCSLGTALSSHAHASTYSAAATANSPRRNRNAPRAEAAAARVSDKSASVTALSTLRSRSFRETTTSARASVAERSSSTGAGPRNASGTPSSSEPSFHTRLARACLARASPPLSASPSSTSATNASRLSLPSLGRAYRSRAHVGPSPGSGTGSPSGENATCAVSTGRTRAPTEGGHASAIGTLEAPRGRLTRLSSRLRETSPSRENHRRTAAETVRANVGGSERPSHIRPRDGARRGGLG